MGKHMHCYTHNAKHQSLSKKTSRSEFRLKKVASLEWKAYLRTQPRSVRGNIFAVRMSTENIFGILYNETAAS